MKVRKLIEMLAKRNWDAQVVIDPRFDVAPSMACCVDEAVSIKSISSFEVKSKSMVTLNTRTI